MKIRPYLVPSTLAIFLLNYPMRGGDTLGLGFVPSILILTLLFFAFAIRSSARFVPTHTDSIVIIYFLLCTVSIAVAEISDLSLRYIMQIFFLSIVPYAFIRYFGFSIDDAKRLLAITPYFTLAAAASMFAIVGPSQILSYSGFRLGTEALNPVGVGYAFGLAAIMCIFATKLKLCNFLIAGLAIFISMSILILTGSRASILAVALIMVASFLTGDLFSRRVFIVLILMIAAGYFVFSIIPEEMITNRFVSPLTSASVEARFNSWLEAFVMFEEHPFFGHGLGSFEAQHGEYVHNVVLEHMANGGIVLTLPFLFISFFLLYLAVQASRRFSSQIIFALSTVGVYSLFVRQFSLSMANTKEVFLFLALAVCCAQDMRRSQKSSGLQRKENSMDSGLPPSSTRATIN